MRFLRTRSFSPLQTISGFLNKKKKNICWPVHGIFFFMYYQTLYSEYAISCQKFHFIVTHRKREASICCAVLFTPTKQAVFFFQWKVIFTQKRSVWPPRSCSCCQDPVGIYCEVSGLQWISPLHTEITCSGDLSTCSCRFVFSFPSQSVRATVLFSSWIWSLIDICIFGSCQTGD